MARRLRRRTVRDLAREAGIETDDAIVALWDAGFDTIAGPTDQITGQRLKAARRAVNIPTASDLRSLQYWEARFSLTRGELRSVLAEHGIDLSAEARRLPKGSVRRVRQIAKGRRAPPVEITPPVPRKPEAPAPEFVWRTIGHKRKLRFLNEREIEAIHWELVRDFEAHNDPIVPPGIKSPGLLSSAVFRPRTAIGGTLKYPTVEMSGAALLHSLVHNHSFHNGNKRTALVSLLVFLDENHFLLTCNEDAVFTMVLQVARHRITDPHPRDLADREALAIADWIGKHSRSIRQGERPLPFLRVRRILTDNGCTVTGFGGSGSKVNIERTIPAQRGILFRRAKRKLHTQVYYGGDGREVPRNTINKIRSDLELDERHGVDSAAFYEDSPWSASDFIISYRKTLDRLSGL